MGTTVVKCQYPEGSCDLTVTGTHVNNGEQESCGACGAEPPEGFDEWNTGGDCSHDYCIDADQWRREYEATARYRVSREEREEIMADRELFMDEFHGRDPWLN
jgi:hypothetical protein